MKILITGNMGYVGPSVVDRLRLTHPKATLIGYDVGYFGSCISTDDILPECKVDLQYHADLRDFPAPILDGVNAIVHLAGISNDPIGSRFEKITFDINYHTTVQLAKMAKKAGVSSFVFASSCSMYGSAEDSARTEKSALNPLTAYAKSKVYAETDLQRLADDKFNVTCLRFSTACGMSDRLRLDLVLNDFVAGAIASRRITILSDGTPWRPLINVKDMARAIDWAITRGLENGGEFLAVNVGSDQWNYQVINLAEAVAEIIPGVDVSLDKNAQPDKRSYRVCFDLFKRLAPKHQPEVDLKQSIQDLSAGLERMHFHDEKFRSSRHMRLKVLMELQQKGLLNEQLRWTRMTEGQVLS